MGGDCTINEMVMELSAFAIDGRNAYRLIRNVEQTGRITLQGDRITTRWARARAK